MLTISKPLSGGQARTYHAREFAAKEANYWSREQQGHSEWQGKLAQEWSLVGSVGAEHFARLTEGQHPATQDQMVRHQPAKTYENQFGREVTSVEHRAGWDATFSAPKSVSLTALVGGDERVREAHRESVRVALGELEGYTQARLGNVNAPERTGKFAAGRSVFFLCAGTAWRTASRTMRRCTPSFRATPITDPTPNSYSRRICSYNSTLALQSNSPSVPQLV